VRFELVDAEKAHYPVEVLCSVLDVSRSGYYAWKRRPPSRRARDDARLAAEIAATHARSGERYGSPRVHRALARQGVVVGRKRVERLMRENQLVGRSKRRFRRTTDSNHPNPIAPNVVARRFEPSGPNEVWAGDVTYVATDDGWAYLAVLLDLFSRRVIGWAMSRSNDTELAVCALTRAVRARGSVPAGLVHHTDRGGPYASHEYRQALAMHRMVPSMSRKGDCWDNAVAESFFATLRAELLDHVRHESPRAAETSIHNYIEGFYNVDRLHSYLDYVSPIEFELRRQMIGSAA
jgi:transposase InsO family protein